MSYIQQFFTSRDNNANAETFVGQEGRLWWDPVTNQIYSSDGSTPGGIPLAGGGGGNGSPGGSNGQVQFNLAGNFGGSANLTFAASTGTLTAANFVGNGVGLTNVAGANVSGTVGNAAHASVADVAYSVDAANVVGTVANAAYAISAGSATTANSATVAGTVTTAAQPNITSVGTLTSITSTGNISTTGNVSGNYFIGNGSLLTGIASSSYSNANVAAYLPTYTGNLEALTGNVITTANVSGNYILGNGSQLTGLPATYGNANVVANLAALGSNPVSTTGNITAGYFLGNGSQLTGIVSSFGNSNVVANLAAFGSNPISTSGNVTAGYFLGNGSQLTGIVSSYGNSNVTSLLAAGIATNISTTGTVVAGNLNVTTAGNNLSVGHVQLYVANNTMTTDNGSAVQFGVRINTANIFATGIVNVTANVDAGNLRTVGQVSAAGNITTPGNVSGNFFIGNGSQLTGIVSSYGDSNVAAYLAGGTDTGNIITTGNVQGGNVIATTQVRAQTVSASANVIGPNSYNQPAFIQPNASDGNWSYGIYTDGASAFWMQTRFFGLNQPTRGFRVLEAEGNTVVFSVNGSGLVSAPGNVQGGNILTGGVVSATGNVTGSYILGNGSQLTGIVSSYGNANVVANLAALGSNPVSTTGNVTAGNLNAAGLSLSGNILSAVNTTANITTTANISGNFFIGNGSQLTGIIANSSYGNTNVAAYLASGTNTSNIITTGNVSGGNVIGTHVGNLTGTTASLTANITGGNVNSSGVLSVAGRSLLASGNAAQPGISFAADIGNDSGFYLISDGNIGVSTNATLRATFFDTGFSVVGNITGGNLNTTATVSGGTINATTLISSAGNVIAANVRTTGLVTATGNVTGGNILTAGVVSATANINGNNMIAVGTISATGGTNATAFAVGNSAVSNVALGYFPTAGTPAEMAIRDYSTVPSTMYFDNSIGNAGQGGQFSFRGGSSFTQWAKIDQYGINLPTRPAFRVYGAGTTNISATNSLTGNNWAVDFNQNNNLNSTTGVFTAPVAGLYQVNLIARNGGSASTSAILVRKTSGGVDSTQVYVEWAPNSTMYHAGGGTVTKMAVNDTLKLIVVSGTVTFDANDTWSVSYIG